MEIKNILISACLLLLVPVYSQNKSLNKQIEPGRVSGDTIFAFAGETLFFKSKKKENKLAKLKEVSPTDDSSSVLILDFAVIKGNSKLATLTNPYEKNLHFKVLVMYDNTSHFVSANSLYITPKQYTPIAWPANVKCIKIYNLHFKNIR